MNDYQKYIAASRYARWIESENRRETWEETVDRLITFWQRRFPKLGDKVYEELRDAITNLEVMPSMRSLMTAGVALDKDEIAGYNCSFVSVDNQRAFDEIMYILMCGTGVGFSVEKKFTSSLPMVSEEMHSTDTTIVVRDSKMGWASSYRELVSMLYSGRIPRWDVSKVRPAGSRLKTFGGRASGPEPLVDLFEFTVGVFTRAAGRKLTSLEVHDIVCKVADIVVVGGVRRSALISLSDIDDKGMAEAKSTYNVDEYAFTGETDTHWIYAITMKKHPSVHPTYTIKIKKEDGSWDKQNLEVNKKVGWWLVEPQRALANNSVAYTDKPDVGTFMKEWVSLYESKSGERGLFNRLAANNNASKSGRRKVEGYDFGTNPCAEIILRSMGLCNLSEVVCRADDTFESLRRKVRLASILGTLQSTLTNFRYVRSGWRKNAEEERLLGVSLTGIMDSRLLSGNSDGGDLELEMVLEGLKNEAIETNQGVAKALGVSPSVAITTIKPSGTVSQLVDSASGIHPRYAEHYIRTVRADVKDPLAHFLAEQGVPNEPCAIKPDSVQVFSFPMKAPSDAVMRNDMTAIQQLEHYLVYAKHWSEHSVSITVYVREEEWFEVGAWVYEHFDELGGVSFLPHSDHTYKQAPYQEIDEIQYNEWVEAFPDINWHEFREEEDTLDNMKELACVAGQCEI